VFHIENAESFESVFLLKLLFQIHKKLIMEV